MPKYLFIAEKPSLARSIQDAYNTLKSPAYSADIVPLRGHFMELQEPEDYTSDWGKPYRKEVLPMIPDKFKYRIKTGVMADYKKIKAMLDSGKYDAVVNSCDAGREGEAIFWTLYNYTGCKIPAKRLWASDVTVETLATALGNLYDYSATPAFCNLRNSSLCRMEFDWLVGMNLSRACMLATHKAVSVGRVKSPTLNIVVQRDLEILNFKPKDYYEIECDFDGYKGNWFKGDKTSFDTKADADAVVKSLGNTGTITDMKTEKITSYAPSLYSLAELQKDANRIYGFTAAQTLDLAQALYETHKILSYPRTEATVISTAVGKEIPQLLNAIKDVPEVEKQVKQILSEPARISSVCSNKKYVDNKKLTDHHALINTKTKPNLSKLTDNEKKLYILVVKRFVSIFLDPQISMKTTIITENAGHTFKTVGTIISQRGYNELWKDVNKDSSTVELPKVSKGETRTVKETKILSKKTNPPKPYTDASLLDAMQHAGKFVDDDSMKEILDDTKGIGTSATRASIIDGLIQKSFLLRKGKTIRATDFGIETIKFLDGKDVISPILTAKWEERLRNIEDGSISDSQFRTEMKDFIKKETEEFLLMTSSMSPTKKVIGKCPVCGNDVIETGNYFMCSHYKKEEEPCEFICGKTVSGQTIKTEEFQEILTGKPTKQKRFKSQAGKPFMASLGIVEQENSNGDTVKKIGFIFSSGNVIGKCPKCGNNVIDSGGVYKCENDDCSFFIAKILKGATLTETDVKNMISGKSTSTKKFFTGKKPWYAKLKYSSDFSKIEFDFQTGPKK